MLAQLYTDGIDVFTSVALTYEAWFASPLGKCVNRRELQTLARILLEVQQGACIDIGAGTGHIASWLVGRGHRSTERHASLGAINVLR
jgi:hypothetical protein